MKKLLLFLLFTTISKAFAFDWSLHRSVTARALSPMGFSINAIDQISDANIYIDRQEGSNPATHADSEAFEAASALMRSRLRMTAISVINGDMKTARATFGYITHTVQDFYAHTNYVEYMPGAPIDLLHLTNPPSGVTCSKSKVFNGLTSGYYPDSSTPPKKCSHSILNKDSGNVTANGAKAVSYAESATAKMYGMLEQEVISMSADQQKAVILLARFKGEGQSDHQQYNFENHDEVALISYNETFKVTPFAGMTQYSSDEFDFESSYTAGLKIELRINERIVIGGGFTHSSMTLKEEAVSAFDYSSYGADLFSKFYLILESRFQPYVGAGVGYLNSDLKHTGMQVNDNSSATNTLNGEVMGGIDLMFTRKIGFNFEAKYLKAVSSSTYTQAYPQTFGQYAVDKLAREIDKSGHLILTAGMIVSF
jgi:outer membrane protein W